MHSLRGFLLPFLLTMAVSSIALAWRTGIGRVDETGAFCNRCHSGEETPTVTLRGPTKLAVGATGLFSVEISGGAGTVGGLNVATDLSAAHLVPGADTQNPLGPGFKKLNEVTHVQAKAFSNGKVSFDFSVIAPATPGQFTLNAAGNSTNGDNTSLGDKAAATSLLVQIVSSLDASDAGTGPIDSGTPDSGTQNQGGSDTASGDRDAQHGGCASAPVAPVGAILCVGFWVRRKRQRVSNR